MEFWQYGVCFAYTQGRAVIWGLLPKGSGCPDFSVTFLFPVFYWIAGVGYGGGLMSTVV